jgi:D-cysteine desulfhydrase
MPLPLFERFPGTAGLPRVQLCTLPTPLEPLALDGGPERLAVKRDDRTSALYGGNKVRKLEFLLGQALAEGRKAVLTFGAYGSNHALATAVHARALGLEPHVVLSPQAPGPFAAATLRAHAGLGTVLHLVDGWDGRREAVIAKRQLAERDGIEPLVIPMGGTNGVGAAGYVNAALEVLGQLDGDEPDVVYVAGGTLGTAVGLAVGFAVEGASTRVRAIRVTPGEVANVAFARSLAAETVGLLRAFDAGFPALGFDELGFELRDDWFEPGYGVVTPETTDAVEAAAGQGVKLETTYTGKAMAALLADTAAGALVGEHVVFWDTYNSAPMPAPGDVAALPDTLQEYVAVCDEVFGPALTTPTEGDAE